MDHPDAGIYGFHNDFRWAVPLGLEYMTTVFKAEMHLE